MQGGREVSEDHVAEDIGAVIVIFPTVLHKREPVHITDKAPAISSESTCDTGLHIDCVPHLSKSNPHTVWLKALHTFLAMSFSLLERMTGYLTSLPSLFLSTFPSNAGDFLASA